MHSHSYLNLMAGGTISIEYLGHDDQPHLALGRTQAMLGIPVRIEDEGNHLHLSLVWSLSELYAELLEPLACFLDIIHGDGDVAETSSRLGVPAGVSLERRIVLRAMIVGEF